MLTDDEIWSAIDSQRGRVAEMLETLTDEQWEHPSLCDGWTVRDVGAHLTLQQMTLAQAVRLVLRNPSHALDVNRLIRESSRTQARALSTEALVAAIRGTVGQRRHNPGVTHRETLVDILVHGMDIAVPLNLELEIPAEAAAEAAMRVRSLDGTSKNRVFRDVSLREFTLRATDYPWSAGGGPEIRGPVRALLLLLTGRPAGLADVTGPGADVLRRSLVAA
jgi:uncharacterized protein (TIGR03083 family)